MLLNYFFPALSHVAVAFPLANPEALSLGNQQKIIAMAVVERVSFLLAHCLSLVVCTEGTPNLIWEYWTEWELWPRFIGVSHT